MAGPCPGQSVPEQLKPASPAAEAAELVWLQLTKTELRSKERVFQGDYMAVSVLPPR